MKRKALIVYGGWDGHEPDKVARIFEKTLLQENFEVEVYDTLDAFLDFEKLKQLHLIVPIWTMGKITKEQVTNCLEAVASGVGIAGCHGGMCDAFRECVEWQFMTGGQWVSHPGGDGVEYIVNIKSGSSPIVEGIKDFKVKSEQYYVHIDPAIEVLATTRFPVINWYHAANGEVDVPVVWTKRWGLGRVFYNSLGHHADIFDIYEPLELMRRGFLWAAEGKDFAINKGLDKSIYEDKEHKMF
ncbi:ThuA domain-containing protein [Caldicellulosiruptoraceae bacterium PP1]